MLSVKLENCVFDKLDQNRCIDCLLFAVLERGKGCFLFAFFTLGHDFGCLATGLLVSQASTKSSASLPSFCFKSLCVWLKVPKWAWRDREREREREQVPKFSLK